LLFKSHAADPLRLALKLAGRYDLAVSLEHDAEKWTHFSEEHHAQLIEIDHVHAF
jgi:hypothetical protein